uniref:uncharacterized protein LOC122599583 isoform X2 n=1 Tax=Erigeron canadensis TaxID=72917 RepID=UPI001CB961D3|nr:uncharacterized protein LOC122599583 isoform X2 [Erigeron canadensis]
MATEPLTTVSVAMTVKKMDMSLDDIIKMSKNGNGASKGKQQRIPNKNQKFFNNGVQDKAMKMRRFMDSRSSMRQGALAQRRSNYQGNQFPFTAEAARKAAIAPMNNRNFNRNQATTSYKSRAVAKPVQNRGVNGGFPVKQQQQMKVVSKQQKSRTLDSLFANMKEERMKKVAFQQNNGGGRRFGAGQQRPRPPWTRYNN